MLFSSQMDPFCPGKSSGIRDFQLAQQVISVLLPAPTPSPTFLDLTLATNMVRGSGKFKQKRGGGRSFSRDMVVDSEGVASGTDRR